MRIPPPDHSSDNSSTGSAENQPPKAASKNSTIANTAKAGVVQAVLVENAPQGQLAVEPVVKGSSLPQGSSAPKAKVSAVLVEDPAMPVTDQQTATQIPTPKQSWELQELVSAIGQDIKPVPTTRAYSLALVVVTLVMILLPVIYVGLIFGLGAGIASYAYYGSEVLRDQGGRPRATTATLIAYFGPLIIGSIGILFMIKPLFARPGKINRPRSLQRRDEPKLFAFVDRLCRAVHSPPPKRIDINCDVNASASFRRGLMSVFLSRDLVLTIGMPLVAGLTVRQFGGVLAHEFGHFSQGFGMRLTYIVRSISFWFARVVYQRDRWDEALEHLAKTLDIRIGVVLHLARIFVWLTRRILWCLMMIGNVVSCYLLRQMEYDADLHEIRFAGSDAFTQTAVQLRRLSVAYQQSLAEQEQFFLDGKLANDMPRLTQLNRDDQTQALVDRIAESTEQEKATWHDTHPTDRQRMARAQAESDAGIFHLEAPACALFTNYTTACQDVTTVFFKEAFEEKLDVKMLVGVDQLVSHKVATREANLALRRQFGAYFRTPRMMNFAVSADLMDVPKLVSELKQARETMISLLPNYSAMSKELDKVDTHWMSCQQVAMLLRIGAKLKQADFEVPVDSLASSTKAADDYRRQLAQLNDQLRPLESAFERRTSAAMQLLATPAIRSKLQENSAILVGQMQATLACLERLQAAYGGVAKIRNDFASLRVTLHFVAGQQISEAAVQEITRLSEAIADDLKQIKDQFSSVEFPFEHASGRMKMAQYLIPEVPANNDFGAILTSAENFLNQYHYVYYRGVGSLALLVQHVESTLGLPPQVEPDEPTDDNTSLE